MTLHFGPFLLDAPTQRLLRNSDRVKLRPRSFDVLHYLAARHGQCVTREELLREIWKDSPVCDSNLSTCIAELRTALGDSASAPNYIVTVPRRGYRFAVDVESRAGDPTPPTGATGLIGRDVAWQQLVAASSKARDGSPTVVLLTGEAGIGKSALVNALVPWLHSDSSPVIARGQCLGGEAGQDPFFAIADAIHSLASAGHESMLAIARRHCPELLFASESSADETTVRRVVAMVEAMAVESPLVLVIEDLHCADPSTIDVVSALAWRRNATKLLLVATARLDSDPRSRHPLMQARAEMLARGMLREITLSPWSIDEVSAYLRGRGIEESLADDASSLHARSGGNPLFLNLLLEHAVPPDSRATARLSSATDAPAVPPRLKAFVESEIAALPTAARQIVDTLSIVGTHATSGLLAALLGEPEETIEQACRALVHRGILCAVDGASRVEHQALAAFTFRHHVYAEIIAESLAPSWRQMLVERQRGFANNGEVDARVHPSLSLPKASDA